ncbi:MAG: hypothetical protein UW41_C0023G0002 [Candidatus Collierbacteria bacterium GW2011_GWC2_44_18]|uniref:Uncharacterized protein n=1 Tax=Candidatus Collierbacteria bacterium GW2011_GWC2_44_18 TaxID=1618392 RepID=A0A0G1HPP8_9BACT|nr:MAG: hypothetical protein UW16_C0014G0002 [Microgenomates group bacterium GW2011_GWC1_44_10]KKT48608.1 MAG: hypothetical protein UW41_C0023G0002 [Candidatus Collierbacteria bacterium GW2011_GWC2_44_18]
MEPIVGIVPSGDVPPTAEFHPEGIVIRFFKHNQRLVRFNHQSLLAGLDEGAKFDIDECFIRVLKKTVVFTLKQPEAGHGVIKLRIGEFVKLIGG